MAIINVLDKKVYNRISAGEVVERPASVIKELVENSIDAGATKIDVQITGGGIASMQVTDNGCGIEREQLERAFLPHATSKISKAEDLDDIVTLGFRGEALASIGAVSRATIISKPQEQDMGMAIDCNGGELSEVYENPAIAGTTVICKDLFFNTPVRAKFLKSAKTEENEVIATLLRVALSRPNVAFTLVCDGKTAIETFGGGLKECISCV
ncbi:MAG: ATP-binding protein, partial [Clostridia bacterium]|nr:ATP-binding protein [Clostridia bacterium]